MRLRTIQTVAALSAALAFVLAFMAAGALLVSSLFMALGLCAIGWLVWSLLKGPLAMARPRGGPPAPTS